MSINSVNKFIVKRGLHKKGAKLQFKAGKYYYWSGLRAAFEQSLKYIEPGGRALDIGAGFANETKALLELDCNVSAVDNNPSAVRYLRKLEKRDKRLTVLNESLPAFSSEGKFDVIVCEMVLHFLNEDDARISFKNIQEHTKLQGINVISLYIDSPSIHKDPRMNGYFSHLFKTDEIKDIYKGWEMLYFEVKKNKMGHESARFVTRKSGH